LTVILLEPTQETCYSSILCNLLFFHNFHIISLFNLLFFNIVHILSLFDLPFFHIFHIISQFSSVFSKSVHYSAYFSSIFSKLFHYSTDLSSIFSISFRYSTYFSSILSKFYLYSTYFSSIFPHHFSIQLTFLQYFPYLHYSTYFSSIFSISFRTLGGGRYAELTEWNGTKRVVLRLWETDTITTKYGVSLSLSQWKVLWSATQVVDDLISRAKDGEPVDWRYHLGEDVYFIIKAPQLTIHIRKHFVPNGEWRIVGRFLELY
jgi:hypothetical protein